MISLGYVAFALDMYGKGVVAKDRDDAKAKSDVFKKDRALMRARATAGLDVLVARAVLQNIERLRSLGKCILFSTHIMREAEKLCDQIAIVHRGHILAEGTLHHLCEMHQENDLEELFFRLISEHDLAVSK